MATAPTAHDDRARNWKSMIVKHLREHPVRSLDEAKAAVTNELARLLDAEAEAEKDGTR